MKAKEALGIIAKEFPVPSWGQGYSPFEVLIAVILSQSTNRENTIMGFNGLRARYPITPEVLAETDEKKIQECIRPAGLHRQKSKRIKEVARRIVQDFGGDLGRILELPPGEARELLLNFPGVGRKTADVVLAMVAGRDTFPVDVHITRISKRLGIAGEKADYDEIKEKLEELIPRGKMEAFHLSMIEFGREICKARNPKCSICAVNDACKMQI
jgi:endonuclease-3